MVRTAMRTQISRLALAEAGAPAARIRRPPGRTFGRRARVPRSCQV